MEDLSNQVATKRSIIGKTYTNKRGFTYEVVEYVGPRKVLVRFEDGYERECGKSNALAGRVGYSKNYIKVGDVFTNNQGCEYRVIEAVRTEKYIVEFQDASKFRKEADSKSIRRGSVKNPYFPEVCGVGYVGVGKHACTYVTEDGKKKNTEAYEIWSGVMRRCYDAKFYNTHPAYSGCSVNIIWHNFQNFANWFYNHPHRCEGWHLDKDIMVKGNKEYGPLRCTFVPHCVNVLTTTSKAKRGKYPIGVYFKKDIGKFRAQLATHGGFQKLLIESHDPHECFLVYKEAKEQYMKEVGEQWEGKLDPRVITSLKTWVVKETD